jgi:hypothetical protein
MEISQNSSTPFYTVFVSFRRRGRQQKLIPARLVVEHRTLPEVGLLFPQILLGRRNWQVMVGWTHDQLPI